jgi:hypothetical protein
MTDDLVKRLWESDEASALTNQAARRIEELETEIKLLSEGATIAHLRGAMDAHANRADDIWAEFKDKWDGERKFALRQIVRWLKNTPGGEAEGE